MWRLQDLNFNCRFVKIYPGQGSYLPKVSDELLRFHDV